MKFRVGAILAAVAMFVAASPTYAQSLNVGVKVGVNFADVSLNGDDDEAELVEAFGNKTGFVAGGFIEVPVSPAFSFAPEVLFTQKGSKAEILGGEFSISVNQIQVPVLFKANFSSGSVRPFVTFGPAFGFQSSSTFKQEGITGEPDFEEEDDDIESVEYSLVFGGGVKFGQASIEARYDFGLSNLDSDEGSDAKSRTFSVLFGFSFGK